MNYCEIQHNGLPVSLHERFGPWIQKGCLYGWILLHKSFDHEKQRVPACPYIQDNKMLRQA